MVYIVNIQMLLIYNIYLQLTYHIPTYIGNVCVSHYTHTHTHTITHYIICVCMCVYRMGILTLLEIKVQVIFKMSYNKKMLFRSKTLAIQPCCLFICMTRRVNLNNFFIQRKLIIHPCIYVTSVLKGKKHFFSDSEFKSLQALFCILN